MIAGVLITFKIKLHALWAYITYITYNENVVGCMHGD